MTTTSDLYKLWRGADPAAYPQDGVHTTLLSPVSAGSGTVTIALADVSELPQGSGSGEPGVLAVIDEDGLTVKEVFYNWTAVSGNNLQTCSRVYGAACEAGDRAVVSITSLSWSQIVAVLATLETDKVSLIPAAVEDNFASFDASGDIQDSGANTTTFAAAVHTHAHYDHWDIIVDAAGGADYSTLAAASAAAAANARVLVRSGSSYAETDHIHFKSGQHWHFDPSGGGVNVSLATGKWIGTAAGTTGEDYSASVSGSVITVGVGEDLTDLEANPTDYQVIWRGQVYDVTAADNAAHTITVDGTPPDQWGGANWCVWVKDAVNDLKLTGLVTIDGVDLTGYHARMYNLVNANFDGLDLSVLAGRVYMTGLGNVDLGCWHTPATAIVGSGGTNIWDMGRLSGIRLRMHSTGYNWNDTNTYTLAWFGGATGARVELLNLTVHASGWVNGGTGGAVGIKSNNASYLDDSSIRGLCIADTSTVNLTNCNTAGLLT